MTPQETSEFVLRRCRELGFALAGIAEALPTEFERELVEWLAAGRQGEMDYLNRNTELRIDPRAVVPGARSIICVADRYGGPGDETDDHQLPEGSGGFKGRIARYARGDDYHVVMKKRLHRLCSELAGHFPSETFRACVDTAPVLEREHAERAGLGSAGKNTLLLQRGIGSYLLLGEIITTLHLPPSARAVRDPCGTCTRCIDACPTNAISPWSVDASRCISYLTIEHRGPIDAAFHEPIGDWLFGCDVCQEVCPHNQPTERTRLAAAHPAYAPRRAWLDLLEVLDWDGEARRREFTRSSMKRARLDMMKRNALIVAGNALRQRHNAALKARIVAIADDPAEGELVRQTAADVLSRLA